MVFKVFILKEVVFKTGLLEPGDPDFV